VILLLEKRGSTAHKLLFTTGDDRKFYETAIEKISFSSGNLSLQIHYYTWISWMHLLFLLWQLVSAESGGWGEGVPVFHNLQISGHTYC